MQTFYARFLVRSTVERILAVTGLLEPAKFLRRKMRKITNPLAKHGWWYWTPLVPERELADCYDKAIGRLRERGRIWGLS
jgi:hypothetical protein